MIATPDTLRRGYSLAIALLLHAILVVLLIGMALIPRGAAGPGGEGVGLEWQDGDEVVAPATAPVPVPEPAPEDVAVPEAKPAAAPPPAPPRPTRLATAPGGHPGGDPYLALVRAHLARFRQPLPPGVRSRGTVALRFRLSAKGEVTQARVARSSGDAMLDEEALQLLLRAAPLPARVTDTELIVPIEFSETAP